MQSVFSENTDNSEMIVTVHTASCTALQGVRPVKWWQRYIQPLAEGDLKWAGYCYWSTHRVWTVTVNYPFRVWHVPLCFLQQPAELFCRIHKKEQYPHYCTNPVLFLSAPTISQSLHLQKIQAHGNSARWNELAHRMHNAQIPLSPIFYRNYR